MSKAATLASLGPSFEPKCAKDLDFRAFFFSRTSSLCFSFCDSQTCVPFCARTTGRTAEAFATATKAGRAPTATCQLTTVNYRIARDTGNAIKEFARATPAGKEITATSVNICIIRSAYSPRKSLQAIGAFLSLIHI